ncbi:onanonoxo-7-onima-8-eninoihtemlysoneda [Cristinia sonorae]|uniref:Onanonoxo-7-onima-8-eninoihtemlysoneda n=1 Tax=Cristinia sonorae TaxID=1940300 RepID=A0A8K0UK97_9AGAR|nr:onanonoxo-7-onima-8-eninoihtemlysoneda [Cristinia sonorae]
MSLLFKNLRVHQVFGANTDVGKTLLTTALVRASSYVAEEVYYLKPVSTGPLEAADDEYVKRFAGPHAAKVHGKCLFRFAEPVSPHLAARLSAGVGKQNEVPTDNHFINSVANHVRNCAKSSSGLQHLYIETAGGVHSPTLSGTTQLEAYRPLFLPTILIGDSRLGGISATISSYESLALRGYIVDAILLFRDGYYRNSEYLRSYFADKKVHVADIDAPPEKHIDPETNLYLTDDYYQKIVPPSQDGEVFNLIAHLDDCHHRRLEELESMPRRTLDTIWWPFVQHSHFTAEKDVTVIDSASSDVFSTYNGRTPSSSTADSLLEHQFDGSASWWTQALGHAHPSLALAAARAAGRYGHVMFPQAIHLPALKLAERLIHTGPGRGWASRAFFSDDGSTGMEVAIKMALRAFAVRSSGGLETRTKHRELGVLGLKGSYHGDTIGAMDACEEGVYTSEWHEAKGFWFEPPIVSIRKGRTVITLPQSIAADMHAEDPSLEAESFAWAYDVEKRLDTPLAETYRSFITRSLRRLNNQFKYTIAALVLEPIVMGAGGMLFVDPLFQRILVDVVRSIPDPHPREGTSGWSGIPVIFDEVFVGFYRLGVQSTIPLLGVCPDISVHAKVLTGGLLPLSVTLASESIFRAFYSDKKVDALLHGHSYTAYPVGCEVANETLEIIDGLRSSDSWREARLRWVDSSQETVDDSQAGNNTPWSFWDREFVNILSNLDAVKEVMSLGTVLSIKIADAGSGYQSHSAQNILAGVKQAIDHGMDSQMPGGAPFGINYRTLGDVAYFMLSLNTPPGITRVVEQRILDTLSSSN